MFGSLDASGLWVVSACPVWLSPIGWGQQMRPFGGDH
jgi:ABC-2 type transport system permease protein